MKDFFLLIPLFSRLFLGLFALLPSVLCCRFSSLMRRLQKRVLAESLPKPNDERRRVKADNTKLGNVGTGRKLIKRARCMKNKIDLLGYVVMALRNQPEIGNGYKKKFNYMNAISMKKGNKKRKKYIERYENGAKKKASLSDTNDYNEGSTRDPSDEAVLRDY